jgi:hypothetical protein
VSDTFHIPTWPACRTFMAALRQLGCTVTYQGKEAYRDGTRDYAFTADAWDRIGKPDCRYLEHLILDKGWTIVGLVLYEYEVWKAEPWVEVPGSPGTLIKEGPRAQVPGDT